MLLYQVPKGNYVKLKWDNSVVFFDHIDGMYSYCIDKNNEVCHYSAWTEVEIVQPPEEDENDKNREG